MSCDTRLNLVGRRESLHDRVSPAACLDVVIAVPERLLVPGSRAWRRACVRPSLCCDRPSVWSGSGTKERASGLRRQSPVQRVYCRIGKAGSLEAPNAASSKPSSRPPPHDGRLSQHRPRIRKICEYNTKCAYKNDHAIRPGPRGTRSLPRSRHCRKSHPAPASPSEAHSPAQTTVRSV